VKTTKLEETLELVKKSIDRGSGLSEEEFERVAISLYELHARDNPSYVGLDKPVSTWTEIPLLPISKFKTDRVQLQIETELPFPGVEFRSSGTTQSSKSRHLMRDTEMYKFSIAKSFPELVLGEDTWVPWINFLAVSPVLESSSLYYMMEYLADSFHGKIYNGSLLDKVSVYDFLIGLLPDSKHEQEITTPVVLLSTSLAYYDLTKAYEKIESSFPEGVVLPLGSGVIETGGWKGRSVDMSSATLSLKLCGMFGLSKVMREYSMSELSSQMYAELSLPHLTWASRENQKEVAEYFSMPWLKYRVLDPISMKDVPPGESGVVAFYDLANVWSCPFILTEDQGRIGPRGGLVLEGRVADSDEKGCSLTYVESVYSGAN